MHFYVETSSVGFQQLTTKRILTTVSPQGSEAGVEKWLCVFRNTPTDNSDTPIESEQSLETGNGTMLFLTRPLLVEND